MLSYVNPEILIQYSKDLINIIKQLQSDPNQQQTIFYALKIILSFFYIANNVMDSVIQDGYLHFFQNLLNFPEIHIRETDIFITALFFSSSISSSLALNSSIFTEFVNIYQSYLKIQNLNESLHILMVISNAFNNIIKFSDINNNDMNEIVEKIFEIYSLSFNNNYETRLISRFIELIQIFKLKKDFNILPLLFKFNIPSQFYQILIHSQLFKNESLFFFAYFTSMMNETDFLSMKHFFNFKSFVSLIVSSNISSTFNLNYAFLILTNSLKFDNTLEILNLISSDKFLAFIEYVMRNTDFKIKYGASQCLFSALSASTSKSLQIAKKFFSSQIVIIALEILECDISEFTIQILMTLFAVISRLNNVADTNDMEFYNKFKEIFFQLIEELQNSSDEEVKMLACEIQQRLLQDEQMQISIDPKSLVISFDEK